MAENEKELLHLYLKEQGFIVEKMSPEILDQCYKYCAKRLDRNGDYAVAFESLREMLLNLMGIR